jgi:hypothetical protein
MNGNGGGGGLEAALHGIDLEAFRREAPIWRFGTGRAEVVGCDVRINVRALAKRLGQPDLLAPANAARVSAALAEGLLKSFLHPQAALRYRHFVHVPAGLLALPGTWALLDGLPVASRYTLVLTLSLNRARQRDLDAVIRPLAEMGVCVCLAGIDFATMPFARVPPGVVWLRGPVTPATDLLRAEAALAALAPVQAIAEPGEEELALQIALAAGFLHTAGPAADEASQRLHGHPGSMAPRWQAGQAGAH